MPKNKTSKNKTEEQIIISKSLLGLYIWWFLGPAILVLSSSPYFLLLYFTEDVSNQMLYIQPFSIIMVFTFLLIKKNDLSLGATIFNVNNTIIYAQGFRKPTKYCNFEEVLAIKRFTLRQYGMYFWAYKLCLKNGEERIISDLVRAPRFLAYFEITQLQELKKHFKVWD